MENSSRIKVSEEIKLDGYRWVIITIFGLYSAINFFQFMEFNVIAANVVEPYYGVSPLLADMAGLIFMILFAFLFVPMSTFVEKHSLTTTSLICAGLTAVGNCLKLLATSPSMYYLIMVSQSLCAIAQVFVLIVPTKIVCTWFGSEEVSTACSIGVFWIQAGLAIGSITPAFMVHYSEDYDMIEEDLWKMFLYNAIVSVVIFVIVVCFYRSKPAFPPSQSQADLIRHNGDDKMTYWTASKKLVKNKDFLIVLFAFGVGYGVWVTISIMINQIYTAFFPDDHSSDLGLIIFEAIVIGGWIGTFIFGYLLDKTHEFKSISLIVLTGNLVCFIGQAIAVLASNKVGTFILISAYGFFGNSLLVISFEYATETTYPIPEEFGLGILNAVINIFAIIYVLILTFVFEAWGYLVGYLILIISLTVSTASILFISPELKRRNANLKGNIQKFRFPN